MNIVGPAKKLSAYIGEKDSYDGKPLYTALVEASKKAGCAGATSAIVSGAVSSSRRFFSPGRNLVWSRIPLADARGSETRTCVCCQFAEPRP